MTEYFKKYIKYKTKYLNLVNQLGLGKQRKKNQKMKNRLKKHKKRIKNNNKLFLLASHGIQMIKDSKKSNFYYNNHLLFEIPPNVSIIFFTNLGTYLGSYQCELERYLINSNYDEANTTFSSMTFRTKLNHNFIEESSVVNDENNELDDIEYIRYKSGDKCPNLELNLDPILKYSTGDKLLDTTLIHIQKTGLFEYPLNKKNFYINDCLDEKKSYGISTINPYIVKDILNILLRKSENITKNFNILKKKYFKQFSDLSAKDKKIKVNAINSIKASVEGLKEHNEIKKTLIEKSKIGSLLKGDRKYTLKDICNYVSKSNVDGHNIIYVYTCRGDEDNDDYDEFIKSLKKMP